MLRHFPKYLNTFACCFFLLQAATAQSHVISTKISLADWGIDSLKDVRFGVLALTRDKGSEILKVNVLRTQQPRRQIPASSVGRGHRLSTDTTRNKFVSRATWVWNTDELLRDSSQTLAVLSEISHARFDKVFLQLPRNFSQDRTHDNQLRSLVGELHARGAGVYALAGDPQACLPIHHATLLQLMHRVIEYNTNGLAAARFVGVHLDIEPYLLPGFTGPKKNWILEQYLAITRDASQVAHEAGLVFGTDIPFWYGLPDEFTGVVDSVDFDGARKPVNEHVTDLAGEICIMSYRTDPHGLNGIVALSENVLAYAERSGKKIFVGLETGALPDEEDVYFQGIPTSDPTMLGKSGRVICLAREKDSVEVSCLERGQLDSLIAMLCCTPPDFEGYSFWEVRNSAHMPSTNLSFANLGKRRLDETIGIVIKELGAYKSLGGVAIHHEASFAHLPE